jgi:hypothetical protein
MVVLHRRRRGKQCDVVFFYGVAAKQRQQASIAFFSGGVEVKTTITTCWRCFVFRVREEKDYNNASSSFPWCCCGEEGDSNLLPSPSSMVVLKQRS